MIKLRNEGEYYVILKAPGAQAVSANDAAASEPLPFAGVIKAVYAKLGTAGTTSTQLTDLQKNHATLLSSGSMFSFASTSQDPTYGNANLLTDPTPVSKGDILSLVTSQINTTPGRDLAVAVVIARKVATGDTGAMQTGTYGADSDAIS